MHIVAIQNRYDHEAADIYEFRNDVASDIDDDGNVGKPLVKSGFDG